MFVPGGVNLFFTLLLWLVFATVLLSNRTSKVNQWCFIGGMLFSLGALKEYMYFDLYPFLCARHIAPISPPAAQSVYSVMTAVLYLFAMPVALIFSMYFSEICFRQRRFFFSASGMLLIILAFMVAFRPDRFRYYQLNSHLFWVMISVYNLLYGAAITAVMLKAVHDERKNGWSHQKRRTAVFLLPLLWYWLIAIFVIHMLSIRMLFHVWQSNIVLLSVLFLFYLVMAFREGMMGLVVHVNHFSWNSKNSEPFREGQGTNSVIHFYKNEIAKINWCVDNLVGLFETKNEPLPDEIHILKRSTQRLGNVVRQSQKCTQDFELNLKTCCLYELIDACVEEAKATLLPAKSITFSVDCGSDVLVNCDTLHLSEVLANLIGNAVEAIAESGTIKIRFAAEVPYGKPVIYVEDTGSGMTKDCLSHLFEPYYTSKHDVNHIGLGLFYCSRVMKKHHGTIEARSKPGMGSIFILRFPMRFCVRFGSETK